MRAGMRLRHTKICQQQRHRFRGHRAAAISMDGELPALDSLPRTSLRDQFFRQGSRFALSDHPAHYIAAKHIQNDVQIKVGPFCRSQGWLAELGVAESYLLCKS